MIRPEIMELFDEILDSWFQITMVKLIDDAVDVWREVADDHGLQQCNCFREKLAGRLISAGVFNGYTQFTETELAAIREAPLSLH